ncbi:unnamed protein product [Clonostachys rhizophaga]|uniref:Uncharacterized protein n=1 Tax=Clonostachys rhizophaga TaxID=160324 RepID=A0A9N9YL91_9HYPO|nr:unnamed protein product [Clonostachys rhizophaga]
MPSLRKFLKEKLTKNSQLPVGHSPEFDTARERWQKECTQDQVLADFTKYLRNGSPNWPAPFKQSELDFLEKSFAAHARPDKTWDQDSLKAYLQTQVPEDGECQALLTASMPSLWALTVYFAQWPFNTASSPPTSLELPEFLRSLVFLSGRHNRLFHAWQNQDIDRNRKTDQPVLEYIFRALATSRSVEQPPTSPAAKSRSQTDVLDVLSVAQPVMSEGTKILTSAELTPVADRLAPPTPPDLSGLAIIDTKTKLVPLLEELVLLLDQASKFEQGSRTALVLKKKLQAGLSEIQKEDQVLYDVFSKSLDSNEWTEKGNYVDTIYDSIALLFNTFLNPQSLRTGRTVNWSSGNEEALHIFPLRSLGATVS